VWELRGCVVQIRRVRLEPRCPDPRTHGSRPLAKRARMEKREPASIGRRTHPWHIGASFCDRIRQEDVNADAYSCRVRTTISRACEHMRFGRRCGPAAEAGRNCGVMVTMAPHPAAYTTAGKSCTAPEHRPAARVLPRTALCALPSARSRPATPGTSQSRIPADRSGRRGRAAAPSYRGLCLDLGLGSAFSRLKVGARARVGYKYR
jgi:hypothetical protein